jgi:hypothetical protein
VEEEGGGEYDQSTLYSCIKHHNEALYFVQLLYIKKKEEDPRWQLGHSCRPPELCEPGTLLRGWRHP